MRNILSLMVLALLATPALAPADKKDDELRDIDRDVGSDGARTSRIFKNPRPRKPRTSKLCMP